jgi:hypothetical protein
VPTVNPVGNVPVVANVIALPSISPCSVQDIFAGASNDIVQAFGKNKSSSHPLVDPSTISI